MAGEEAVRRVGVRPAHAVDQAQKAAYPAGVLQPLPPLPAGTLRATSEHLEIPAASGPRVFHVVGDTGGVMDPNPQKAVVAAMVADLQAHPEVGFAYHVGDAGYFNGEPIAFTTQFFEAYDSYLRTIVGIPGNHDGDPLPGSASLAEWMAVFCSQNPVLLPGTDEYNRDSQTQPYCYWTLEDDAATIIGLYSNVPSGGEIDDTQALWLAGELAAAPTDKPLIVTLHHPPYSADGHHGGSAKMGTVLDRAFLKYGARIPDVVISGHVHDYQRFTRTLAGHQVRYIVCGAGGYHNLHAMATGASPGLQVTPDTVLEAFDATRWGFLRLTVDGMTVTGEYVGVAKDGTVTPAVDTF